MNTLVTEPITCATKDSLNYFGQKMSKNGESWSKTTIAGKSLQKTKVFPEKDSCQKKLAKL
jgi:hypothetical protein